MLDVGPKMAKLIYDNDGRLLFTKEMKKEYKILMPMMLPIHFSLIRELLVLDGYDAELLTTTDHDIIDTGLKYVHNDICYPAQLVIGQFIHALQSGKYDVNKTALFITQTGGGCRASNYIHLLRKGLKAVGLEQVPVISVNLSGMEKNPGFKLTLPLILKMIYCCFYGDMLMLLSNRCRAYEIHAGETEKLVQYWQDKLISEISSAINLRYGHVKQNLRKIAEDFSKIELNITDKVRVGIVGEIYIKYAPLGNNNLQDFLESEGCEVIIPGLMDFISFKADNRCEDSKLYGGKKVVRAVAKLLEDKLDIVKTDMREALSAYPQFEPPKSCGHLKSMVKDYLGYGNKMGEGWLLTGEMIELIHDGVPNIVCTQPFGCLPNHIAGKGMIRLIKKNNPNANIVAIDYDPGSTKVNQENRIRLMLSNAREQMKRDHEEPTKAASEQESVYREEAAPQVTSMR